MTRELTIGNIVNSEITTLKIDTPLSKAIDSLVECQINGAPVCDADGQLVGFFSTHDLMIEMWCQDYVPNESVKVGDLMKTDLVTADISDQLTDTLEFFALDKKQLYPTTAMGYATSFTTLTVEERARTIKVSKPQMLPVLDQGKYVGVVSRLEVLKALRTLFSEPKFAEPKATVVEVVEPIKEAIVA
ncbi:CBS domain-containing protein [Vibrio maerlii]|uniref:CBS domain-containing protein n=1 Tax=Vibrio maerlii TaxID=2231648 RepID=UPI000E3E156E|nr:CBS domain-containing protein [Vibrio maerlii]